MSVLEATANAIRTYWNVHIETSEGLPTQYDNTKFQRPKDGTWARLSILDGSSQQVEQPRTYRSVGVAVASIFGSANKGDRDHRQIADKVVEAFRAKSTPLVGLVSGFVEFLVPSAQRLARSGEAWRLNVNIPYRVDEVVV